jgi:hypothetical protein
VIAVDDDTRAARGEQQGVLATDAGRRAGYERDLAVKSQECRHAKRSIQTDV